MRRVTWRAGAVLAALVWAAPLMAADPVFPPRQGFMRGFAIKRRLMHSIANAHFADLARPLRIVAANLATLERVVFSSGPVATPFTPPVWPATSCPPETVKPSSPTTMNTAPTTPPMSV